jgi:hypothetical protein
MATKKKKQPAKKTLDQADLLAAVSKAGEIDLSDLMIEGFAYPQVEEAVNEGKLAWTESGGVKLAEVKKTSVKKAARKAAPDKPTDDVVPEIPEWLSGFTTSGVQRKHMQSLWEHNPGFRKRVLSTQATDSVLGSNGNIQVWKPTERLRSFYQAAMRFEPLGSPSACSHPQMVAYGKQGNSVGYCIPCDGLVYFAVDGKPARVEKPEGAKKGK